MGIEGEEAGEEPYWTRDGFVAAAVFTLAILIRLAHLQQISLHDPYFTIPSVDGAVYHAWSLRMLAGHPLRRETPRCLMRPTNP